MPKIVHFPSENLQAGVNSPFLFFLVNVQLYKGRILKESMDAENVPFLAGNPTFQMKLRLFQVEKSTFLRQKSRLFSVQTLFKNSAPVGVRMLLILIF
jgi:hypothetical protein